MARVPVVPGDRVVMPAAGDLPEERGEYVESTGQVDKKGRPTGVVAVDDAYVDQQDPEDDGLREALVEDLVFDTEASAMPALVAAYNRLAALARGAGIDAQDREKAWGKKASAAMAIGQLLTELEMLEKQPGPEPEVQEEPWPADPVDPVQDDRGDSPAWRFTGPIGAGTVDIGPLGEEPEQNAVPEVAEAVLPPQQETEAAAETGANHQEDEVSATRTAKKNGRGRTPKFKDEMKVKVAKSAAYRAGSKMGRMLGHIKDGMTVKEFKRKAGKEAGAYLSYFVRHGVARVSA